MFPRHLTLPQDESLFLFGARASGKTTLLQHMSFSDKALFINLLKADAEQQFRRNPDSLEDIVKAMPVQQTHVVIDEIQKVPKLLDVVHHLIETTDKKFVLTGSSARKLKHGGANLLAGRAFVFHLYPFTYLEVQAQFVLNQSLRWGMLPKIYSFHSDEKKQLYLEAYASTYLREEIWGEQLVRNFDAFRHFLEVAAQSNGKVINFSNIARDCGLADNTVRDYFSILEDTLIGFFLNAYEHSFRKRLGKAPKFYFFDVGVVRTLQGLLTVPPIEQTSGYGDIFEHFIILQCVQLSQYFRRNFRFSYLATKDGAEVDLVVERPGQKTLFIEIKSSPSTELRHVTTLQTLAISHGNCEAIVLSRDPFRKQLGEVIVYPWQEGIQLLFAHPGPA